MDNEGKEMNIKIINDKGVIWCIVVDESDKDAEPNNPIVNVYDCRHEHTNYGQLVSSYHLDTLLDDDDQERLMDEGLDLCGYEPHWKISGEGMNRVIKFLKVIKR